ncbi:bone morphogenetic protein 2-like [Sceloporus undulatus]|uniref:bone morphogenetic protein 2-like n=1 Tax=Sceloporus undulatus TaxID=8520 RepID=UPI001C4B1F1F|nr:bone morphogenetic protein 2-like [Sceloporus undulatus]
MPCSQFWLLILFAWVPTCLGKPSQVSGAEGDGHPDQTQAQALKKLLEVFGMEGPPQLPQHPKEPPQYMVDLYNAVAGDDGIIKNPDILMGNTVRSFLDKTHSVQMHLHFDLSNVAKNEKILSTEFHLFKLRPKLSDQINPSAPHFCQVDIFQVLDKEDMDSPVGKRHLCSRKLAVQGSGWEIIHITQAVREWTEDESSNQGLLVTVGEMNEDPLKKRTFCPVRFASGRDHHESKKPMLVVFTDDGRQGAILPSVPFSHPNMAEALPVPRGNGSRMARSAEAPMPCQRLPLLVDFEEIGWSSWIISPRGYNAFHCQGACSFPLGANMRPTTHATVQSIVHALKLRQDVQGPCCVPDQLYSISLLYFDEDANVVLKQYDNMVAGSCGCH